MSYFAKRQGGVIDLHPMLDVLASDDIFNKDFLGMAQEASASAEAGPPLSPAAMNDKLQNSKVTNGNDIGILQGKYEKTFLAVLGKTEKLKFYSMSWVKNEEWEKFCEEVLPECKSLTELTLGDNRNLEVDIAKLVE